MLTRADIPRLSHVLKSVPKNPSSIEWIKSVDEAHLSTWLKYVGAITLNHDLSSHERDHLSSSLDLPAQLGGVGLQSLVRAADEKLLGSWASNTADLIKFSKSKDLTIYTDLANALDSMADAEDDPSDPPSPLRYWQLQPS